MGKISDIVGTGIAGSVSNLEFRQQHSKKGTPQSPVAITFPDKGNRFFSFVLNKTLNRKYLLIALVGTILQFVVFKILYPFPDFISDSYSYIATNIYHMDVNLWPIGYSIFLSGVHMISHSDTFLVGLQYFLLEGSLAYLFFSVLYLYRPAKSIAMTLYIFLFFNPMFLYLSNAVLSDSIFAALTIVFLTQFLWMFHRSTITQIIVQGVIIGLCFPIRYTAIYYPLVALVGLLLSKHKFPVKVFGFLIGIVPMVSFYFYTKQKTKEITGTSEFSVFGGWQIANNALYMYGHINVDSNNLPPETHSLDEASKQFFERFHPSPQELAALPGTYFMKVPYAILKPYMAARYSYDNPREQFKVWGLVSPIYKKYGTWLITNYPIQFAQYYLWLNTKNYFLPHLEKFEIYNLGIKTVPSHVQDWFGYITPYVRSISANIQGKLFYIYPILFMVLNFYFMIRMCWLFLSKGINKLTPFFKTTLIFISFFLFANFCFSVFATPVVLRYQLIPLIFLFIFSMFLLELPGKAKKESSKQISSL